MKDRTQQYNILVFNFFSFIILVLLFYYLIFLMERILKFLHIFFTS